MATATSEIDLDQLTGDYTIDPSHTRIGFQARHAMVTKVRGQFLDFEGGFHLDPENPEQSSANLTIQAKSLTTGNQDRDQHLHSNDFFAMDEYPEIRFRSSKVEKLDEEKLSLTGDLTIRGVTRPVTVDFEYLGAAVDPWGNLRIGFEGRTTVNRKDWGISWNAALEAGGVLVSEKVTLELDVSATKNQ